LTLDNAVKVEIVPACCNIDFIIQRFQTHGTLTTEGAHISGSDAQAQDSLELINVIGDGINGGLEVLFGDKVLLESLKLLGDGGINGGLEVLLGDKVGLRHDWGFL
jgi:hypothetical protein